MLFRALVVVLAFGVNAAQAQLKPPGDNGPSPRLQATPMAPANDPATIAKEEAAAKAAEEWLKLIDSADYGKAWDECATVFRDRVPRQQWIDGLPKRRAEFGTFKSRKFNGAGYSASLPGAPDGDYVTVRYSSDFEKNPSAEEVVTLTLQSGTWRPVGYLFR
jgi:hypothetical protein